MSPRFRSAYSVEHRSYRCEAEQAGWGIRCERVKYLESTAIEILAIERRSRRAIQLGTDNYKCSRRLNTVGTVSERMKYLIITAVGFKLNIVPSSFAPPNWAMP